MAKNKILVIGGVAGLGLLTYALWKMQQESKTTKLTTTKFQVNSDTPNTIITDSSPITTTNPTLPSHLIKNAYWSGSQFVPYSSLDDAIDKNFDESFVNRTATIYALDMNTGTKAYLDVSGLVLYTAGIYYFETTGQRLQIANDGTMTFSSDVEKPTNLSATSVTESYN